MGSQRSREQGFPGRPVTRGVAVLANLEKPDAAAVTRRTVEWLESREIAVRLVPDTARAVDRADLRIELPAQAGRVDFLIVLGGDGSLLGAARLVASAGLPLLGVNLGRLGFLTEIELPDLCNALPFFLQGNCVIDERTMLAVELRREGSVAWRQVALNEVTVSKGPFARPVDFQVLAGGQPVATYPADGVIVATPTGSTAYSLSAGGPILHPGVEALLVTPICAHTLYARTLVVPAGEPIGVVVSETEGTVLTVDGQLGTSVHPGDEISVGLTPERARLLRRPGWKFYRVLGAKLPEGGLRDGQ